MRPRGYHTGNCCRCDRYKTSLLKCNPCGALVCIDCKGMHRCIAHLEGRELLPEGGTYDAPRNP